MAYQSEELIHMLKCGSAEDRERYIQQELKTGYADSFPGFMTDMLEKYGVKKGQVADRTGLSKDYTLKLLRGDKATKERDYILAMAIAIGMDLEETQHALNLNGMASLDRADPRSAIIADGIVNRYGIHRMNEFLENAGFYDIKVSPDMPSSPITLIGSRTEPADAGKPAVRHQYEQLDVSVWAEHTGSADPLDYDYGGTVIVQDEAGNKYYVQAGFTSDGSGFSVLDEKNYLAYCEIVKNEPQATDIESMNAAIEAREAIHAVEEFDSISAAASSEFFEFYNLLDRETDKKCGETLRNADDTRNYGARIGATAGSKGLERYMEAFNTADPARREYLQIRQSDDGTILYTVSHQSYYLRYLLDEMYDYYYRDRSEPEYYISTDDLGTLRGDQVHLRFMFHKMLQDMHIQMPDDRSDHALQDLEEKLSVSIETAVQYMNSDRDTEAVELLDDSLGLMDQIEALGGDETSTRICTLGKINNLAGKMGFDFPELREQICDLYDKLCACIAGGEDTGDAPVCLAEAMLTTAREEQADGLAESAESRLRKAIDLLKDRCRKDFDWRILVALYAELAFTIDEADPKQALEYTGRAIEIINDHSFFFDPESRHITPAVFFNHGWVLWERLHDDEAEFYYRRAVELQEAVVRQDPGDDDAIDELRHNAEGLYRLYTENGQETRAGQLQEKMRKYHIELPE